MWLAIKKNCQCVTGQQGGRGGSKKKKEKKGEKKKERKHVVDTALGRLDLVS